MLPFIVTADSVRTLPVLQLQGKLLEKFFFQVANDMIFQDCISQFRPLDSVCSWEDYKYEGTSTVALFSVYCNPSGVVKGIFAHELDMGRFDIRYIPPTVSTLNIMNCWQRGPLDTRLLPRVARSIDVSVNFYEGKLNLAGFPGCLQSFAAANNQFEGKIALVNLPRGLEVLNLSRNRMKTTVIYYDAIPKSVESLKLDHTDFTKVRPLQPQAMPVNKSIFFEFEPRQIV